MPERQEKVSWFRAPELQVLDDDLHPDGRIAKRRAGDLYDLKASSESMVKPAGSWNHARVVVRGDHIQHWLNGEKVVDVQRSGPEWEKLLADSKFAEIEDFGKARRGYIVLQDHSDPVWFRNIKIREF